MQRPSLKQSVVILCILTFVIGLLVVSVLIRRSSEVPEIPTIEPSIEVEPEAQTQQQTIGTSVEGRAIESYTYGTGSMKLLFVGGMHGGYEWNSVLLAYQFMDYLEANPEMIPDGLTITVIPSLNPDGVYAVLGIEGRFTLADVPSETGPVGTGRFNARGVDLNRNFDCKWKPESTWRGDVVSAGTAPFSEPEALALKNFVIENNPVAVVFWHSQANAVYASECQNGVLPETRAAMNTYAGAAGYPSVESFDAYPISGDAEGWLASIGIPAITVELATHATVEWEKNLAGTTALIDHYSHFSK